MLGWLEMEQTPARMIRTDRQVESGRNAPLTTGLVARHYLAGAEGHTLHECGGDFGSLYNWLERWTPVELKLARCGHCHRSDVQAALGALTTKARQ